MMQIGAQGVENMLIFEEKKKNSKKIYFANTPPFHLKEIILD
jgi:hypothetical protein